MQEIGVGLIGYGLGGRAFHAPYIGITPGMMLRAVVSSNAAKVRSDFPEMRVVPDVEALLKLPDIDLIIVSSPDHLHAAHAISAVRAGKHVVVDKPFASSLDDAKRVVEEAQSNRRLLTIFHNRRWDADFLTLRRLLAEGELGEVIHFESHFDRWRPIPTDLWKEARHGGSWLDLGPHLVDQALCLFGRPRAVSADIASMREGALAPDYFHVVLRYPKSRAILHSSKLTADQDLRFCVHGTRGSWLKQGSDPQEAAILAGGSPTDPNWGVDPYPGVLTRGDPQRPRKNVRNATGDYPAFWRELVAAIMGKAPNPVPPSEALAVMEVLEAGLLSSEQRCEVPLT